MIAHVGFSGTSENGTLRCKFAEDVDTLSPDIWDYQRNEYDSFPTIMRMVRELERIGIKCCIDYASLFYETETT